MKKLNFDELMQLYTDAPTDAEKYRVAIIEDAISKMPDTTQLKARAFQARLEKDTKKCRTPMDKTNLVFSRMWDSFTELDEVLQEHLPELNTNLLDSDPESSI